MAAVEAGKIGQGSKAASAPAESWAELDLGLPDFWEPENAGESREGKFIGEEMLEGENGKPYGVFAFMAADGEKFAVSGKMLERGCKDLPKGTRVKLVFGGKKGIKKGHTLKTFQMFVDPAVAQSMDTARRKK